MTAQERVVFTGLAVLLGVGLALGATELLLRLSGRAPWRSLNLQSREPTMYDPDPELGWRPKPGRYVLRAYSAGAPDIPITLLEDGTRTTASPDGAALPTVAFVGCSFTLGMAVADDETFAWRLQQRFPSVHISNYGRGGYGTYQSLLLMERILGGANPPHLIVYGFVELHDERNVAAPGWLRALGLFSRGGIVATPYGTLDSGGRLLRHPPTHHPKFPLRTYLASMTFLEQRYAEAVGAARAAQARPVTEQLLLEMDRLARTHAVRFAVVLLHASPVGKAHYLSFLQRHQIEVIDCALVLRPRLQVPGEGHPNGQANQLWASCMEATIRDAIGAPADGADQPDVASGSGTPSGAGRASLGSRR